MVLAPALVQLWRKMTKEADDIYIQPTSSQVELAVMIDFNRPSFIVYFDGERLLEWTRCAKG